MTRRRRGRLTLGASSEMATRERVCDALVWLVGSAGFPAVLAAPLEPRLAVARERFWDWLGDDAHRRHQHAGARSSDEAASRLAARVADPGTVSTRMRSARAAVRRVNTAPALVAPVASGTLARVLDHARGLGAAPLIEVGVAAGEGRALWDEPCDTWVAVPPGAGPREHRYIAVRVVGESMLPLLRPDDVVLLDLDRPPSTGSVVVAKVDDEDGSKRYVVKCLDQIRDSTMVLSSLNPLFEHVIIPREMHRLLGTVLLRWREDRRCSR